MVEWRFYSDVSNMTQVTALQGNPDRIAPKDSVLFHLFCRAGREIRLKTYIYLYAFLLM